MKNKSNNVFGASASVNQEYGNEKTENKQVAMRSS